MLPLCPNCEYNLTGVEDRGVCPECGQAFDIEQVLKGMPPIERRDKYVALLVLIGNPVGLAIILLIMLSLPFGDGTLPGFFAFISVACAIVGSSIVANALGRRAAGRRPGFHHNNQSIVLTIVFIVCFLVGQVVLFGFTFFAGCTAALMTFG